VTAIRIVCVDGPLAGVQTSVAPGEVVVLYDAAGNEVVYRIDGLLSGFPGSLYAARVENSPDGDPPPQRRSPA
jgi:hypothetical protein